MCDDKNYSFNNVLENFPVLYTIEFNFFSIYELNN